MNGPDDVTARPALRVVRGEPDATELAALVAVVTATGDEDQAPPPPPRGRWNDPASLIRPVGRPGPGGWRAAVR